MGQTHKRFNMSYAPKFPYPVQSDFPHWSSPRKPTVQLTAFRRTVLLCPCCLRLLLQPLVVIETSLLVATPSHQQLFHHRATSSIVIKTSSRPRRTQLTGAALVHSHDVAWFLACPSPKHNIVEASFG
jgi:hypothetical protein